MALLVIYLASLGRTRSYQFVWDDLPEIATNASFDRPLAKGLRLTQTQRAVPELAELPSLEFGYDSYRPLLYASYWLDLQVWGRRPEPLHAVNVATGALAIVTAFLVARRLLGGPLALLPTALFALHPVQVEAVAYISGRGDLLAGMLGLLATLAALGPGRRRLALTGLAFAASLLAKEAYLTLPLATCGLAFAGRARWAAAGVQAGVAIAYLAARSLLVATATSPAIGETLLAFPGHVLDCLRVVILPFDLSIERAPARGLAVLGWLGVFALAGAGVVARRRLSSPRARLALASAAWFLVLLGPSAIAVFTMRTLADRYFYLPLFGLGVAVAAVAGSLADARPRWRRGAAMLAGAWALLLLFVEWRQVEVWRDVTSLYHHAAAMAPDSSRAQYRVAVLDIGEDRWDRAVPRLERAIELDATNVSALNNLGVYRLRTGDLAAAETLLARAVSANPARFNAWSNLGLAQHAQGKRDLGCASIARALSIHPRYEPARRDHDRLCR